MNNLNKFGIPSPMDGFDGNSHSRVRGVYEVPTDFVELPSKGRFYSKDSPLYGVEKLEVKYMTTKEEDILVSPGLIKAGIAVDRLIESLVVDKRVRAKDLLLGDKSAILMNARKNAFGQDYNFSYLCQKCGTENLHNADLEEVKIKESVFDDTCSLTENGTALIKLPKSNALVEVKFLKGEDELAIDQVLDKRAKNNLPDEALTTRYRYMIVSVNGNSDIDTVVDFINSMPILDSKVLRKKYAEINPNVSFTFQSECKKCNYVTEGEVPISANFFWPEL